MPKGQTSGGVAGPSKRRHQEENEETEDLNISQMRDFPKTSETHSEAGIIEMISMKNFMCHSRLTFDLGNHVNFIIGRNGSGKSAVLTSLVVGLGGKANVTSRGSSLKNFIKQGKQSAEVVVKLRNRGADAYEPDKYGESIIVERTIRADGAGVYKLKSAKGRLVSTKREELLHILDQFNIQVDNPVSILNQETSRNFLHSKSPHDRYKFFLRATQLEQLKLDYNLANEQKEITNNIVKDKQEVLPTIEKEVDEWGQKKKALVSLGDLRKKVDKLKQEMAWAQVYELERTLEPVQKELGKAEARTPKFEEKVTQSEARVQENLQKQKELQEQLKQLGKEVKNLQPEHEQQKKELAKQKKAHRDAQMELRRHQGELHSVMKDRNQTQERIDEMKNSAQQDFEIEKRTRLDRIAQLEQQSSSLRAQQHKTQNDQDQYKHALTRLQEELYRLKTDHSEASSRQRRLHQELKNLEESRSNRVKRFGNYMPHLLRRIDEETAKWHFHQKPRGPLGANINLRDPKWALGVEACLKNLVHAFCCHDHHDEQMLEKIFKEVLQDGRRPMTITSKFLHEVHDVSKFRTKHPKYPTILDMLDIQDPVVINCLIDQRSIENVLLIWDKDEARTVMSKNPPPKCDEAFTPSGDHLVPRPTYRYYSSDMRKANFLSASVEEDIRNKQEELQQLGQELQASTRRQQEINKEIGINRHHAQECQTRLNKLRSNLEKIDYEVNELKNIEDPTPVDVSTLEEDVEKYNEDIKHLEEKLQVLQAKHEAAKSSLQDTQAKFKEVDERIRAIADSSTPLQDELGNLEHHIEEAKSHKHHYKQKMNEHKQKITELKDKLEAQRKVVQEETSKAEEYCERVSTRRTAQNLESEINQIIKRIKAEEKTKGDVEVVTRTYHEKLETYTKIKEEVKKLNNFLKYMKKFMMERQKRYFLFRKMIAMRAKYFFMFMLNKRNYQGKMVFDHQLEKLSLSVQTGANNGEGSKDMRALSGGERSFSTVCFILSLWDAMESPFRCLDEFDIYMDMINRRISMDLMMDVTSDQRSRQFIFLTPQDMSHLQNRVGQVRIYRMPDPERNQGVLPFEAASQEEEEEEVSQSRKRAKRS